MSCVAEPLSTRAAAGTPGSPQIFPRPVAARDRRGRDRFRRRARRAPALAPPRLRARACDRALGGRAAPRRRSTPAIACRSRSRSELDGLDADRRGRRSRGRLSRMRRRRRSWRRCAPATCACVISAPTSALRELTTYERTGTAPIRTPSCSPKAVYGLTELHREAIATPGWSRTPGCYPTASTLALAPLARAGLIADLVIDAKQGLSGAGPRGHLADALLQQRREHPPVQHRPPPSHAGDRGAARAAARRCARRACACSSQRTSCRSTRASWSTAT